MRVSPVFGVVVAGVPAIGATRSERGWFSRAEVAAFLGVSVALVDRDVRPRLPAGAERRSGQRVELLGPAVVAARLEQRLARSERRDDPAAGDPLLREPGDGCPHLAEYRRWRARAAELDVREREGQLLPRQAANESLGRLAARIRGCLRQMERDHGPAPVELIEEVLADWVAFEVREAGNGVPEDGSVNNGKEPNRQGGGG